MTRRERYALAVLAAGAIAFAALAIIAAGKGVDGGITNPTFLAPAANNGAQPSRA